MTDWSAEIYLTTSVVLSSDSAGECRGSRVLSFARSFSKLSGLLICVSNASGSWNLPKETVGV